jgi:hypothetical protein
VNDETLAKRVRSTLGFLVRYPSFIDARVNTGRVVLGGGVFADEVEQLIDGVLWIRGVRKVESRLQIHRRAEEFPNLQGELRPRPAGRRIDLLRHHWSPSIQLIVGCAAVALLALGALAYGRPDGNGRKISPTAKE